MQTRQFEIKKLATTNAELIQTIIDTASLVLAVCKKKPKMVSLKARGYPLWAGAIICAIPRGNSSLIYYGTTGKTKPLSVVGLLVDRQTFRANPVFMLQPCSSYLPCQLLPQVGWIVDYGGEGYKTRYMSLHTMDISDGLYVTNPRNEWRVVWDPFNLTDEEYIIPHLASAACISNDMWLIGERVIAFDDVKVVGLVWDVIGDGTPN